MGNVEWTWAMRVSRLAEQLTTSDGRKKLFQIWHNSTSTEWYLEDHGPEVRQWQVKIGQALLDWDDIDQAAVKERLGALVGEA